MINETNQHSWCVNADHAMRANNNRTTKICCMIENVEKMSLSGNTIEENFNKIEFIKIRETLQSGVRHEDCHRCWQEEDAGRKSKRMRDNEKYLGHLKAGGEPFTGLAKFELNLGNKLLIYSAGDFIIYASAISYVYVAIVFISFVFKVKRGEKHEIPKTMRQMRKYVSTRR